MSAAWVAAVVLVTVLGTDLLLGRAPAGLVARLGRAGTRRPARPLARAGGALRAWWDRRDIESQLPGLTEILAGAVAVGMSVPAALEHACRQLSGPLRRELDQVLREYHLGVSLAGALRAWELRARSRDVELLVETLELVGQVGGGGSAALAQLALTLERRRRDRQDAWAHMAEARLSAAVVAAVPPLVIMVTARSQSEAWRVMVETPTGHLALAFAAASWLAGVAVSLLLLRPPR